MMQERQGHLGMGSHQSSQMLKDEWLTPPEIIKALGGPESFDLDPCAPIKRPWDMAKEHYTIADNGLLKPWHGRVWFNPPYGGPKIVGPWMRRMAEHGHGTTLIFARTETDLFFETVWKHATALLFLRGRLYFHHVDGTRAGANAGAPSVLIAYGERDAEILDQSSLAGHFVRLVTTDGERRHRPHDGRSAACGWCHAMPCQCPENVPSQLAPGAISREQTGLTNRAAGGSPAMTSQNQTTPGE